eukprot:CAMPEP_0198246956 /NCGR_PEP_ID=MMETSP1446-20131203/46236_1 /TAXON_ID=1461542 ORGANISM="Unidentified sp, Strain CCMP2111" /NCGR_SAMPLE_ID=MMETSP1446 /ASSEMBLY_ACC=CAM_ASM_001112 /LENGTH=142 /DNA_ID=CAMNT_0043931281 /DNA_START=332 /DNA_END=761 /DNA_ORIENTATION=+
MVPLSEAGEEDRFGAALAVWDDDDDGAAPEDGRNGGRARGADGKAARHATMAKRTKKVGIVGKYGTRYGSSLRKQVKKIEISQHSKYVCLFCGKTAVKRTAAGIWSCRPCKRSYAGGAYSLHTGGAATVRSTIRRLREAAAL